MKMVIDISERYGKSIIIYKIFCEILWTENIF
jgi:hypothetical protein